MSQRLDLRDTEETVGQYNSNNQEKRAMKEQPFKDIPFKENLSFSFLRPEHAKGRAEE